MRLNIKPIVSYQNNNSFRYGSEWSVNPLEEKSLYFQLVDEDQEGIRYISASGATMSVTFPGLDTDLVKTAVVASADDRSIWKVDLLDTDVVNSGNIKITLTEGSVVKKFWAMDVLSVAPSNPGGSNCACGGGCGGGC